MNCEYDERFKSFMEFFWSLGWGYLIAVGIKLLFFLLSNSGTFGGFIAIGMWGNQENKRDEC